MSGCIQIANKVLIASHVYISLGWIPSKSNFIQLTQLIKGFLWGKWNKKKGHLIASWLYFIQPKNRGG